MKSNMWMVGWVFMSSLVFAGEVPQHGLPSGGEVPAVRKVAVYSERGCGIQPSSRPDLPCPSVTRVTFEVETIGLCDTFTTEVSTDSDGETYLTIIKQRVEHCTRPEHQPRVEARTLILADELRGSLRLGNPILVETHFRQ